MSNKQHREWSEMRNLFDDPKFVRQAMQSIGRAIAMQPATRPIESLDKEGNLTANSKIEAYSYNKLAQDIHSLYSGSGDREPTELEMMLHCQIVKARTDTAAATFIRDTIGAKPVDESKITASVTNPYEQLTDEELELIAARRDAKQKEAAALQLAQQRAALLAEAEMTHTEAQGMTTGRIDPLTVDRHEYIAPSVETVDTEETV